MTITAGVVDVDVFAVELREGDVLGTTVSGAAPWIGLYDPAEVEVMGSTQDATYIYPTQSPLPGGGNAVADHVADEDGWHFVAVTGRQRPLRHHRRGLPAPVGHRAARCRRCSSTSTEHA